MTIITVDGNIGAGKTSILNLLHRNYKLSIDLEPVDKWITYLTDYYNNKNGVLNFQLRVWLDRCWIQEKIDKTLILMERSPYFIRNIFINSVYNQQLITENDYKMLNDLYDRTDSVWSPNIYIYLRSDPEKCFERIKIRNRECETNITLEYIKSLHELHEKYYNEGIYNNLKIVCIDVENKSLTQITNEIYNLDIIQDELR